MNQIEAAMEPKPSDPNAKVPDRIDRLVQRLTRLIRALINSKL